MYKHSPSSLRGWLFLLFVVTTVGFLLIGTLGVLGSHHGSRSLKHLHNDEVVPLHRIKVLTESYGMRIPSTLLRLDAGELTVDEAIIAIRAAQDSARSNWSAYRDTELDESEKAIVGSLDTTLMYADLEVDNTLRYLEIQQSMGNRLLANQIYPIVGSLQPVIRPALNWLDSLSTVHLQRSQEEYQHADRRSFLYLAATLLLVLAGMLIGPLLGMRTLRNIDKQLGHILQSLARMAKGDLTVRVASGSKDELGMIGDGIDNMAQSLREMVEQMNADASTLGHTSLELTTIVQHAYGDAKTHLQQTKQTAAVAQEIALRLESGIDLLGNPNPPADIKERLRHSLLTLRNENMVQVVQGLANTRATAVQSARGMDLLNHKSQLLSGMADSLTLRIQRFKYRH